MKIQKESCRQEEEESGPDTCRKDEAIFVSMQKPLNF